MKLILTACIAFVLVGCSSLLTNDKIITETRKCESAGMKAVPVMAEGVQSQFVTAIQCMPPWVVNEIRKARE